MEELYDSDTTMIASNFFDKLVNDIRSSRLNFLFELTPFGAKISLKKSFIKDKSGTPIYKPFFEDAKFIQCEKTCNTHVTEAELCSMKNKYKMVVNELDVAFETIKKLEKSITERDETIRNIEFSKQHAKAAAEKLNTMLVEQRSKFERDRKEKVKDY